MAKKIVKRARRATGMAMGAAVDVLLRSPAGCATAPGHAGPGRCLVAGPGPGSPPGRHARRRGRRPADPAARTGGVGLVAVVPTSGEDADAAGTDQQPDGDQHDGDDDGPQNKATIPATTRMAAATHKSVLMPRHSSPAATGVPLPVGGKRSRPGLPRRPCGN